MDPISAGANLLGSVFNVVSQERTNEHNASMLDKQNQFNRDMQKDQQQYNKEMWEAQNAYNTPKSQLDRYRQAGLNPNLLYGQPNPGNAAQAATSGQASSSNAIARRAPQIDPLSMSAIRLNESQARKNEVEAEGKEIENKYKGSKEELGIESLKSSINKIKEETNNLSYSGRIEYLNSVIKENTLDEQINSYSIQNNLGRAEIEKLEKLSKLFEIQVITEQAKAANLNINTEAVRKKLPTEIQLMFSQMAKNESDIKVLHQLEQLYFNQASNIDPYNPNSMQNKQNEQMDKILQVMSTELNVSKSELGQWITFILNSAGSAFNTALTGKNIVKPTKSTTVINNNMPY